MATKTVDQSSFENDVLKSPTPVLVDFWAEWCGPCRALAPVLEEISDEMGNKIKVMKLNVDENPDLTAKYNVRGIPTMILFKGGSQVDQMVGRQAKENIVALVQRHL